MSKRKSAKEFAEIEFFFRHRLRFLLLLIPSFRHRLCFPLNIQKNENNHTYSMFLCFVLYIVLKVEGINEWEVIQTVESNKTEWKKKRMKWMAYVNYDDTYFRLEPVYYTWSIKMRVTCLGVEQGARERYSRYLLGLFILNIMIYEKTCWYGMNGEIITIIIHNIQINCIVWMSFVVGSFGISHCVCLYWVAFLFVSIGWFSHRYGRLSINQIVCE